jgi:hypothetical protein
MSEVEAGSPKRRGRPPRTLSEITAKVVKPDGEEANVMSNNEAVTPTSVDRPSMRPAMREEDPRAAAARRAAEIRGHIGSMDEGIDEFRTPRAPDGWEYEWKRRTLLGQEDPAYQVELARMGWEHVPTQRHPEMMPSNGAYATIERKGMTLMMRPAVISDESRAAELRRARNQVRVKEQQLNAAPDGTMTRDHASVRPQISKGFEPIPVPKD